MMMFEKRVEKKKHKIINSSLIWEINKTGRNIDKKSTIKIKNNGNPKQRKKKK